MTGPEIFFWVIWIILIIIIIIICLTPNLSCSPYANLLGMLFWIFFLLFMFAIIIDFVYSSNRSAKPCNHNDNCKRDLTNIKVKYDTYTGKPANIEVHSIAIKNKKRQTVRLTINGTECVNDSCFNCDPTGFSEVATIALPMDCDQLTGMNLNQPIELYSWTAPRGTVYTYSYVVPHGTSYLTVVSPDNIIATGELQIKAQNNIGFTDYSSVVYERKDECCNSE